MPTHYPSSFFNSQYTSGGGVLRLTSWRQSIIPQNTPAYGLNYNRQFGVSSYLIRSGGGALYSFYALNRNTSLRYLTFFDMNSIPTQGMVPLLSFSLPPGTLSSPSEVIFGTDFFGPNGVAFTSGISWGISTSESVFLPTPSPSDHTIQTNYC